MRMSAFSYWEIASHLVDLTIAYLLALPIGWEREHTARSAGIRTFPLVAIGACSFVLIAIRVLGDTSAAQARIIEGLITGVGFIGGGAILKTSRQASGTSTAAGLWATGAMGAAVGYGLYDIAAILSVATFATLRFSTPLKKGAHQTEAPAEIAPKADR
ncbi:MgtC/SapB transporter [Rhodopseudomonas palustris TIE-1]|uniref:MgtC/SapB family protein n=2 Tax=Rhodopseudomonas TaxID=1073 RepID=UPI00017796FD|nr:MULTISPECIES: MgtC/SapB family protein [Rhodopseudomonas]ACF00805.1 MgtC/SapB transporter [Rhodopseudomonas palustris TIE-1]